MKITLDIAKLIGFRVLNIKCKKKTNGNSGVLLQGAKIGKPAISNQKRMQLMRPERFI